MIPMKSGCILLLHKRDQTRDIILLISPIPGPPNTLMSSLDDPPLSLMGIILVLSEPLFLCSIIGEFILLAQ